MSNAKLLAPNDECAECGKHHSEHPEPHFWCDPADSDDFRVFTPKPLQVEGPTTTDQKIKAPFTSEQVKRLNAFQKSGLFHPFTCGNPERTDENHPDRGILVATRGGWVCPNCYYTQDWAHAFMVEAGAEATGKSDREKELEKQSFVMHDTQYNQIKELMAENEKLRVNSERAYGFLAEIIEMVRTIDVGTKPMFYGVANAMAVLKDYKSTNSNKKA